ncbi:MAG: hypothetical protein KJO45_05455, partial [Sulfurovum sp.]|nr:hypothetical protein [Sulfurovum sp.]
ISIDIVFTGIGHNLSLHLSFKGYFTPELHTFISEIFTIFNIIEILYFIRFTQKEYAEQNHIKLSTVKSQVKRGKESMKEFFEECCTFEKDRLDNISETTPKDFSCRNC